jgi:membrane-associated phospholipid phosphatase
VRAWNIQRADQFIPPSPTKETPYQRLSSASHLAPNAPPDFHITYMSRISSDERAWSRTPSPFKDPDAGLKGVDHYQTRLPRWRYRIRQYLIPIVRAETPSLAAVQRICRSPVLDSYFAMSANLGTHTFFMAALPICFWCGYPGVGIALVHMLALGVYFSGYVKDLLCLPRPLSPPLQRITMSGSAALEYGFPSTHTTNAVSAAAFCLYQLYGAKDEMSSSTYSIATGVFYCYALSISIGRIYCGMHGWFDVAVGGLLGALITWMRVSLGPMFDAWIMSGDWSRPAIASIILALAIRFHAEPADNCPCFDDSVAFLGVLMGIEIGVWHHSAGDLTFLDNTSDRNWAENTPEGLAKGVLKVVLGIFVIFLWRAIMKPLCLRGLPPIFRFVDHWGFRLPRRYFLQAR